MKAFVTGGTGFLGRRVVQRLIERGYEVTCLVRDPEHAADVGELGATIVRGRITDRDSVRAGMLGADVVLHIAGWYQVGSPPSARVSTGRASVGDTEILLTLALELGVPRIIYTSSVTALGDTHGSVVDETYRRDSPFISANEYTSYQAHQVAECFMAQGAPLIIVMPAGVYGPGDHSMISTLLQLQLRRLLPVILGSDTGFSFAHVDDVAEGHLLAAEQGRFGHSYALGGDVMTLGDVFQLTARLAGVPAPVLLLGSNTISPVRSLLDRLERFVASSKLSSSELMRSMGWTWWVTSAKAERELGYTHRSIEEGMAEMVLWEVAQLRQQPSAVKSNIALALAVAAFSLGTVLCLRRRRRG